MIAFMAVSLLLIAAGAVWVFGGTSDTAMYGQSYRYKITGFSDMSADGEVDNDSASAELRLFLLGGEEPDATIISVDDLVLTRISRWFTGIDAIDSSTFYEFDLFRESGDSSSDFGLFFAEATKTVDAVNEEFQNPEWVEIGPDDINGSTTTHMSAELTVDYGEEVFITDSLMGFSELFGAWTGEADLWVRDDGLVARIIVSIADQGEPEVIQLDYFDFDQPIDFELPESQPAPQELLDLAG